MADDLNLWDIEGGLVDALAAREEAALPEEQAAADAAIQAYVQAEVTKVDGIAAYLVKCRTMQEAAKAEADRLKARADAWEARRKRLLGWVQHCMSATGRRRLEGRTATLLLKGDGGNQAVECKDPALVPDEYCTATVTMKYKLWQAILMCVSTDHVSSTMMIIAPDIESQIYVTRKPDLSLIHDALNQPCSSCLGVSDVAHECLACGGTGKQGVPGCTLLPRREHVEVK